MIIGIVITLVALLAIAVVVGVARDPGPDPSDVAIGYARALGVGDFDAVYHLVDPELLKGRNRPQWVAEQNGRPHVAFAPDTVQSRDRVVGEEHTTVHLAIGADRTVPVELVRRQRIWVVSSFDGVAAASTATVTTGGILLTGGTSRRLGTDKATLVLGGTTLADRGAATLRNAGLVAVEVGPGHTVLPAVRERPPGSGPLAALVAGFAAVADVLGAAPDAVVLLACDLPHAGVAVDALLTAPAADVVVPLDRDGHAQYVCARYDAALVARAVELLAAGERSLRTLVATVPAPKLIEIRGLPVDALADIDTEADARRWGVELPR